MERERFAPGHCGLVMASLSLSLKVFANIKSVCFGLKQGMSSWSCYIYIFLRLFLMWQNLKRAVIYQVKAHGHKSFRSLVGNIERKPFFRRGELNLQLFHPSWCKRRSGSKYKQTQFSEYDIETWWKFILNNFENCFELIVERLYGLSSPDASRSSWQTWTLTFILIHFQGFKSCAHCWHSSSAELGIHPFLTQCFYIWGNTLNRLLAES